MKKTERKVIEWYCDHLLKNRFDSADIIKAPADIRSVKNGEIWWFGVIHITEKDKYCGGFSETIWEQAINDPEHFRFVVIKDNESTKYEIFKELTPEECINNVTKKIEIINGIFVGCEILDKVAISKTITEMGIGAFSGCEQTGINNKLKKRINMCDYKRRLTYSEVKYGYLRIEKAYSNRCPRPGEIIKIKNYEGDLRMHLTQEGRIDGLTAFYQKHEVKIGDIAHISFISKNEIDISFTNGKNLFEVEIDRKDLLSALEDVREHISEDFTYFCHNETNVRIELIEPILKAIGWNLPNLQREKYLGRGKGTIDFGLYDGDQCLLIIEAKSLENPLDVNDIEIDKQITKYLKDNTIPYYILTNGEIWKLFDRNKTMLQAVNILEPDKDEEIKLFFQQFNNSNFKADAKKIEEKLHTNESTIGTIKRSNNFIVIEKIEGRETQFAGTPTDIFYGFIEKHYDTIFNLQKEGKITVIINPKARKKQKKISNDGKKITWESSFWKKMMINKIIQESQIDARIEDVE